MELRRTVATAGVALLLQNACASTSYTPRGDGRISTTIEDGRSMLNKDGRTLPAGGDALTQFVAGNPAAEEHARSYAQAMRFSIAEQLIGLGALIAAGFVVAPSTDSMGVQHAPSSQRQVAGTILVIGGLATFVVSSFQGASAQAHFQDAINVYNDSVPPRFLPPPPGWQPTSPVPLGPGRFPAPGHFPAPARFPAPAGFPAPARGLSSTAASVTGAIDGPQPKVYLRRDPKGSQTPRARLREAKPRYAHAIDNASAAMPVKPPTTPMLGVTAQLTAVDGLRLGPRAATEAKVHAPDNDTALVDAIRRGDAGAARRSTTATSGGSTRLAVRIVGAERRRGGGAGGLHPHLPRPAQVPGRRRARHLDLSAGGERGPVAPDAARHGPAAREHRRGPSTLQRERRAAAGDAVLRARSSGRWCGCRSATAR